MRFVTRESTQVASRVFKVVPTRAFPHEHRCGCKQVDALAETHVLLPCRQVVEGHAIVHASARDASHVRGQASTHAFTRVSRGAGRHASGFVYIKVEPYGCMPASLSGDKLDELHVRTNEVPRGLAPVEPLASLNVGQLVSRFDFLNVYT